MLFQYEYGCQCYVLPKHNSLYLLKKKKINYDEIRWKEIVQKPGIYL